MITYYKQSKMSFVQPHWRVDDSYYFDTVLINFDCHGELMMDQHWTWQNYLPRNLLPTRECLENEGKLTRRSTLGSNCLEFKINALMMLSSWSRFVVFWVLLNCFKRTCAKQTDRHCHYMSSWQSHKVK